MADISKLHTAVIEKQKLILNKLTTLSYKDVMHLTASLSSIITNLDNVQAEEEVLCNRLIVNEIERDSMATFSKAEAILKASDSHHADKNILSLQCASRGLSLARLHAHHLLNSRIDVHHSGGAEL